MKKTALTSFIFTLTFLFFASKVSAQTLTSDRAYSDYQFNLTVYEQAFSDYENAKNAYLANQTLELKDVARQKTKIMLVDRDQLMVVYLTALRTKISEQPGLNGDDKNNIFGKIDAEVTFYSNHKNSYTDNSSLDDLFATSSQSENQYKGTTILVVDESLFDISLGEEEGLRLEHEKIFATLKTVIDAGVAAGKLTLSPFNNWLSEISTVDAALVQNESTAKTQIAQIYAQDFTTGGGYQNALETLTSSIKPLSQFNEFLSEVTNYLKNHQ